MHRLSILCIILIGCTLLVAETDLRPIVQSSHDALSIDIDPQERYFITASFEGVMKIWDYNSGRLIRTVSNPLKKAFIHPSGEWILMIDYHLLTIADWKTGEIVRTLPIKHQVDQCRLNKSGDQLIFLTELQRAVAVMDINTGEILNYFKICEGEIADFDLDPLGDFFLVTGYDESYKREKRKEFPFIRKYSLNSGELLQEYGPQKYNQKMLPRYKSVRVDPLSRYIMVAIKRKTIQLWDYKENKLVRELPVQVTIFDANYIFQPESPILWIVDECVYQVNYETGVVLNKFEGVKYPMVIDPHFKTAISNSGESGIQIRWHLSDGRPIYKIARNAGYIVTIGFDDSWQKMIIGNRIGALKCYNLTTGLSKILPHELSDRYFKQLSFDPSGDYMLSIDSYDYIHLWDMRQGKYLKKLCKASGADFNSTGDLICVHDGRATKFLKFPEEEWIYTPMVNAPSTREDTYYHWAIDPKGKYLACNVVDPVFYIVDIQTGDVIHRLEGHESSINALAFDPQGKIVVSGEWNKVVKMWDVETGALIRSITSFNYPPSDIQFEVTGNYFLVQTSQESKLIETSSGRVVYDFKRQFRWGHYLDPKGEYLIHCTASRDSIVHLHYYRFATNQETQTISLKINHFNWDSEVQFHPSGKYCIIRGDEFNICNLTEKRVVASIPIKVPINGYQLTFDPLGERFAIINGLGQAQFYNLKDGSLIADFYEFPDASLVMTPEGYFYGTGSFEQHLHFVQGTEILELGQFFNQFYKPAVVRQTLTREPVPEMESIHDLLTRKPAPWIEILSPQSGLEVETDKVTLEVKITDRGGGIGDVLGYVNGTQIANSTRGIQIKSTGETKEQIISMDIFLVEGDNQIKVVGFNKDGTMESRPANLTVLSNFKAVKPSLYALIVGINQYENQNITLNYAVSDALALKGTLQQAAAPLFGNMVVNTLTTKQLTTRDEVRHAFSQIRDRIHPNDLFVFYNASHGVVDVVGNEEQYYLLTSNVKLLSSRHIGQHALSQKELVQLIGSIPAQKKLIILDTCHSGKAGEEIQVALIQSRGLTEATAVKILQRAVGSAVFTASSDTQLALEGYQGHGLFTYTFLEGLKGKADRDGDGFVKIRELADYVEENVMEISENKFKRLQTPIIEIGGNTFPIAQVGVVE
ncbi:caspase family protein [bacterium]